MRAYEIPQRNTPTPTTLVFTSDRPAQQQAEDYFAEYADLARERELGDIARLMRANRNPSFS